MTHLEKLKSRWLAKDCHVMPAWILRLDIMTIERAVVLRESGTIPAGGPVLVRSYDENSSMVEWDSNSAG